MDFGKKEVKPFTRIDLVFRWMFFSVVSRQWNCVVLVFFVINGITSMKSKTLGERKIAQYKQNFVL